MLNKRLIGFAKNARLPLVASVFFSILAACAQVYALLHVATVLEQVVEASSLVGEWVRPIQLALISLLAFFVCATLARLFASRAGAATKNHVTQAAFDKLVELGAPYALRSHKSQLVGLFGEGAQTLSVYMARYVPQFFCAVLIPLVLVFVVGRISVPAAVLMLVFVFCMPMAIMRFMKRAKGRVGEQWGSYTNLSASFHDAISGLSTLKVYGSDAEKQWALDDQAENFRATTMRLLHVQLNSVTFMDLFTYSGIALGVFVALVQLRMGVLGVQEAFGIMLLAPLFFAPMRSFGTLFHAGMNGEVAAEELFALLDEEPVLRGNQDCFELHPEISCKHLSFSYDGSRPVLTDISFDIPTNSIVGITGESGSGKSSLARVLCGQAAPYNGSVCVGGLELSHMDPTSLASLITLVSKQSHLFKGTVRSNMLLADPEAQDAFIWTALHRARVADEVLAAGGLDAPVAEGGTNFSGGQRQRLCFARALLRDTPIYVFDEAASNVDAESEKLLFDVMHEVAMTKTVIVISHRLHMLTWVDEIFVMEGGKLVQRGAPGHLLAKEGPYKALWDRYTTLEEFAARLAAEDAEEPQVEELTPVQQVLASLPGMAQTAMQAVIDAKEMQKYVDSSPGAPTGHPTWIPLPASYREMLKLEEDESAGEGGAGLATSEADSASGADGSSAEGAIENEAQPRGLIAVVRELAALTIPMRSDLKEALFAGFASNLAAVALTGFAASALLASRGLMAPMAFVLGVCGMLLCALARGPLHYGERLYSHDQTFKTLALVRSKVFEAMRHLAPAKLESRDIGDKLALVTSDVELLEGFYSRALTPVLSALVCALAIVLLGFFAAPLLGFALLACCALVGVGLPFVVEHATQNHGQDLRAFAVAMQSFLFDSLEGFSDLLQFGRAQEYASEMRSHFATLESGESAASMRDAMFGACLPAVGLLLQIAWVLLVWFAVAAHMVSVAWAVLLACLGLALLYVLAEQGQWAVSFHQTHAAANRILDLLAERPMVAEVQSGVALEEFTGACAEEVDFAYDMFPVLERVSLEIPQGQVVRVVGPSGCGKTTLLRLFMRFWDVQGGRICLSDTDIRDITTAHMRSLQSYMTQDTYVFNASLRYNIKLANLAATTEELEAVIDTAALRDVVDRLPQGLDTLLGAGGVELSEGERQRLGLARAFLHDAPFMVLDEPTSNLDTLNEAAILLSIAQNTRGKTILVASHRPTMAAISDMTVSLS